MSYPRGYPRSPHGTLIRLHDTTFVAAYWLGFLMADGSFKNNRLVVSLNERDKEHIRRCMDWLEITSTLRQYDNVVSFGIVDRINGPSIRERFDINNRKTYEPPRWMPYFDKNMLRAFLVGFIDGDGHIYKQHGRKTAALATVSHGSWLPFMTQLSQVTDFGYVRLRSKTSYAALCCSRHNDIVALKQWAVSVGLPMLQRKWSPVDESITCTWYERGAEMRALILAGHRTDDIARMHGCAKSSVSNMRARMRRDAVK